MSKNAVVLAVRGGEAVLLEQGGAFRRVPDRCYTVGQILGDSLPASGARLRSGLLRRVLLIACVLALLCSSAFAAGKYMTWTQVTLESGDLAVLYRLNYLDEVIETVPLSRQAETLLSETSSGSGASIETALAEAISESDETAPDILVGVSSVFRSKNSRAVQAAKDTGAQKGRTVRIEEHPWGEPPFRPSRDEIQPTENSEPEQLPSVDPVSLQEGQPSESIELRDLSSSEPVSPHEGQPSESIEPGHLSSSEPVSPQEDSSLPPQESSSAPNEPEPFASDLPAAAASEEAPALIPHEQPEASNAAVPLRPDQSQPEAESGEASQGMPGTAPLQPVQNQPAQKPADPLRQQPGAEQPPVPSSSGSPPDQNLSEPMPQGTDPSGMLSEHKSFPEKH